MAERAPLLPEVTSDVASVPALRHVEADEDGQRDASRARTRGRVRAAFAATGLMALVGAAATRASRPDAGGFFAPSSFSGARLGARRAPRDADADASARPARLTDRIGASDAQHPNSPQQPRAHFRAPTAAIDGIDETRWRPEEMPVTRKPRGAPNEWGSARDELPWWAQPGAANAIAFPDSHEAKTLDRHLAGEGRVQGERERERHADTARLGDKVNESMLQLTPEEAAERSERVAARRRGRQHDREIRDARAQAETASRADPYDADAETKTATETETEMETETETETTPGRARATAAGDDATRANRREVAAARRIGEEGKTSAGTSFETSAGAATTRGAMKRDAGPNAAGVAKVAAEAESKASGKVHEQRRNAANRGATEPGAAEPGGAKEEAKEAARKVAVAETAAADLAVTKPSDAPQPLRFQLTPSDEDRKAGYLPLDVKLSLPLNPFHELLPQQHGNVAAAYGRIGWEQMRAEGEIRLADAKPKLGAEPRAENETEATPGAEPRAENPVVSPKSDHGGRGQLRDGEALAAIRQRENARRARIAAREANEAKVTDAAPGDAAKAEETDAAPGDAATTERANAEKSLND